MTIFEIDTDKKETFSINLLDNFLISHFRWSFLRFPEKNMAIDGLFQINNKKDGKPTGSSVWVQVKTGTSYRNPKSSDDGLILLDLKKPDVVKKWKRIWKNVPGAMLLVYVDFIDGDISKPLFYWVDLKKSQTYSQTNSSQLIIPSNQKLDNNFEENLKYLKDYKDDLHYMRDLPVIEMNKDGFHYYTMSNPIKKDARKFYKKWSKKNNLNPKFGKVEVNRVGWQHVTRNVRRKDRIIQSLQLLSVAEKMVNEVTYFRQIGTKFKARYYKDSDSIKIKQYYYLKAKVRFPHRSVAIIYVLLRKISETFNDGSKPSKERVWFYSVYEGQRAVKKVATNKTQSVT